MCSLIELFIMCEGSEKSKEERKERNEASTREKEQNGI